ncbi:hypothetical protein Tco_1404290 [Tanacetum coccineum]
MESSHMIYLLTPNGGYTTLTDSSTFWEPSWETINIQEYANIRELEATISDDSQKMAQVSENPEKIFSEMDPRLTGINKTEPWWRTADSNAMTSFASDEHVNNFDLHETSG